MRHFAIAPLIFLAAAAPAQAQQRTASATARLVVGEVRVLKVVPGDGSVETRTAADGAAYYEAEGAVTLRVSANTDWQVLVAPAAGAAAVPGLSWRVSAASASVSSSVSPTYSAVQSSPVRVASGGAGRDIEIVIDYRWPAGAAPTAGLAAALTYTVAPN